MTKLLQHSSKIEIKIKKDAPSIGVSEDRIIGSHVFGNLYEPDEKLTNSPDALKGIVQKAIEIAKMSLVEINAWSFGGKKGGVTIMALIQESHVVLHTWHEYRYATLDIYTCGEKAKPHDAFAYIVENLKPRRHQMFYADRGM